MENNTTDASPSPSYEQLHTWLLDAEEHIARLEAELATCGATLVRTRHAVSGGYVRKGADRRFATQPASERSEQAVREETFASPTDVRAVAKDRV